MPLPEAAAAHAMGEEHILPDVLAPGLSIVFCGTAAGTESARRRAYYAHPQNRFWRVLHEAGLTPRRLAPAEFALLPDFGLGLTAGRRYLGRDGAGYGPQPERIGETAIWLLPSPSPTATWKWDRAPWLALGEAAKAQRNRF